MDQDYLVWSCTCSIPKMLWLGVQRLKPRQDPTPNQANDTRVAKRERNAVALSLGLRAALNAANIGSTAVNCILGAQAIDFGQRTDIYCATPSTSPATVPVFRLAFLHGALLVSESKLKIPKFAIASLL